jgi:spore coat protein H
VEAFKQLYLSKLNEFTKSVFQPERFHRQVDAIAASIRTAVQEESSEKLERFEKVVAGEAVEPAGFGGFGGRGRGGPGAPGRDDGPTAGPGGPRPGGPGGFFGSVKPIRAFVTARAKAVSDQLAGKSTGEKLPEFGMGRPGGPGGGPGRPGDFGPGNFIAGGVMTALDFNKDGSLTKDEFTGGFKKWFDSWNTDKSGFLTDEQLRAGINQDLSPFRGDGPVVVPLQGPEPRNNR